jgi:hypothetical protein
MPRSTRLDAPGVVHHVIIRGIERRKIFRDNKDRNNFLERLSKLVIETDTACYAYSCQPVQFILGLLKPFLNALREIEARLKLILGILA